MYGKMVIPCNYQFSSVNWFSKNLAAVPIGTAGGENAYDGYIDRDGRTVVPFEYDGAEDFHNGFAVVYQDNKCGLTDTDGTLVVPFQYDDIIGNYAEGFLPVATGRYPNWNWSVLSISEDLGPMETGQMKSDAGNDQPLFVAWLDGQLCHNCESAHITHNE